MQYGDRFVQLGLGKTDRQPAEIFHIDTGPTSAQEGTPLPFEKARSFSNCFATLLNSLVQVGNIIYRCSWVH